MVVQMRCKRGTDPSALPLALELSSLIRLAPQCTAISLAALLIPRRPAVPRSVTGSVARNHTTGQETVSGHARRAESSSPPEREPGRAPRRTVREHCVRTRASEIPPHPIRGRVLR